MKKEIIIPSQVVTRQLPKNLIEEDLYLFKNEQERALNAVSFHHLSNVFIKNTDLWQKGNYIPEFTSYQPNVGVKKRIKKRITYLTGILFSTKNVQTSAIIYDEWSTNYFHWLCDSLTRLIALSDFYKGEFQILLPEKFIKYDFIKSSLAILGYPDPIIIKESGIFCTDIITVDHTAITGNYNRGLITKLRDKLLNNSNVNEDSKRNLKIYITRRKAKRRKIINEEVLLPLLIKLGYIIVETDSMSFKEQIQFFSKCSSLIGLHGAGLANMLFMKNPQAKIIEIRSKEDDFNNAYFSLAAALEIDYYYLLAEAFGETTQSANFVVDVSEMEALLRFID